MNRIDQSLTDQLFSTKASSRLTDAENSVKSEYATSLFSQKESGSRENTFTSAFNQERRAVRSSASEEPKEDRQTNSAEKEKTGAVVTRKKTRKPNSSKTSSGVELDGESDWAPLSEEDSEPDQAKKAREGGLDPMWLALVNSEALTMVEPLAEGGAFQLERLLWNESGEKARAQALGLSVWIQLSEGKSVSVTTVDTQPLSTELIQAFKRSKAVQIAVDKYALKVPVFGDLIKKSSIARWTRTLSTMFAAGVPLVDALDSVGGAAGNYVYAQATLQIQAEVSTGSSLTTAMEGSGVFPPMVTQMVAIGEESGQLDSMLGKTADFFEAEVDEAVEALSSLMEPIIMVFLGGLIGGLVVAMYLPIFKLGSVVG